MRLLLRLLILLSIIFSVSSVIALPPYKGMQLTQNQLVMNQVVINLDKAATVEVYRGKHLIYSRKLPVGKHFLDTRWFPMGTYPIQIKTIPANAAQGILKLDFYKQRVRTYQATDKLMVSLFVPATVTISNGNVLLSTQKLPAGFHNLDTSKLPKGLYPVTIRSVGNDGKYDVEKQVLFRKD